MTGTYCHLWRPGAGPDVPVLVLCHGTGGTAGEMLSLGALVAPGAAMLSLEGDVTEGGAARFFRRRAEGVYDMEDLAARTAALEGFLEQAFRQYVVEGRTTIGIGYSNGANILANLSFLKPGRFGRLGLMHPLIPFEPAFAGPADALEVAITAGRHDPICPPAATEALAHAYRRAGATVGLTWGGGGHEIRGEDVAAVRSLIAGQPAAA